MGLIQAALNAVGTTISDQWKEYFYCEALPSDVLMTKGQKKTSGFSANRGGTDNIITNGSGIAIADGQAMIIVDNGQVVEFCAEPGVFTWDASSEPSIFCGTMKEAIQQTFATIGKRFTYGGDAGSDQRIYYFNTKEITDNKFGTPNPILFHIVDARLGLDLDASVRCSGIYSYRINDPLLFYTNVAGNVSSSYTREDLDATLKTEFVSALQPAFGKLSTLNIRPSELPAHAEELCEAMNSALSAKWAELRGIEVVSVAMNPITLPEDIQKKIQQIQLNAVNMTPGMANATLTQATADAMVAAANNANGAAGGFMAYNMANGAGASALGAVAPAPAAPVAPAQPTPAPTTGWTCACGTVNTGNFCSNCGKPKPAAEWTCECGTVNTGNFCSNCGKPRH